MAWTFAQAGGTESSGFPGGAHKVPDDEWLIATETITLDSSTSDQSSTVIDFVPYGRDWMIEVDPSATLTSNATIDVDWSDTRAGTFVELATTGASALKAGTASRAVFDNSGKGNRPYYKLRLDKAAALDDGATKTVVCKVLLPPGTGVIY